MSSDTGRHELERAESINPKTESDVVERVDTTVTTGSIKPQVHFSIWVALGVQYSVTGAPIAIGQYLSLAIAEGGITGYFWGYVVGFVFQGIVCLCICELASALPNSSGQ